MAGLKGHVPAEQLQGSMRVAILNLKPAKLAGMASEAMLLAADAPQENGTELVRLLIPPGMYRLPFLYTLAHLVGGYALQEPPFSETSIEQCSLSDQAAPESCCLLNFKLSMDHARCNRHISERPFSGCKVYLLGYTALCELLNWWIDRASWNWSSISSTAVGEM